MAGRPRRDQEILDYLAAYIDEHHYAPSIREISAALGLNSVQSIHRTLLRLRQNGRVEWQEGKARTLRLVEPSA